MASLALLNSLKNCGVRGLIARLTLGDTVGARSLIALQVSAGIKPVLHIFMVKPPLLTDLKPTPGISHNFASYRDPLKNCPRI